MASTFNVKDFLGGGGKTSRYERRLSDLTAQGIGTSCIESAVEGASKNISEGSRSFVIYGEPQSGKTEMMIALTARLLDEGHKVVVALLNDSVQLLEQNLDRFLRSGLDPAPKTFSEILDPSVKIGSSTWVIFCKKNAADLQKLLGKIENFPAKVIIDDEADFATPNAKVNRAEQTRINELVGRLLSDDGIYIGVTATPARLDLNNTFGNENEKWVDFPAHSRYTGQDDFFPTTREGFEDRKFRLVLLPEEYDSPRYLREAMFSFLVNVAYLNTQVNARRENYSMLIHTSGRRADHTVDYQQVIGLLTSLKEPSDSKFAKHLEEIHKIAAVRYPSLEKVLTKYIADNINLSDVVVMNSNSAKAAAQYKRATSPATMFTFAIGGNIVSRGVTFDNLLSMFFTRDVKHKIQQDTYIQRARMFGSRGTYLQHFELHIPQHLYVDWQKCFVFHKLALSTIRDGKGSPIWLEDKRIAATSPSSIDQAAVALDSGEMSWELFDYSGALDAIVGAADSIDPIETLKSIAEDVGDASFPAHVLNFIEDFRPGRGSVAIHPTGSVSSAYSTSEDGVELRRRRGFMAGNTLEPKKFPNALHHVKVFKNETGHARVFYKYTPEAGTIRFLKNTGK